MIEFLAEYMLLAFTMGAILGGAITGHIVMLRRHHGTVAIPNRHRTSMSDNRVRGE
ncbi:MAG: hypothetical protein RBT81_03190 [Gammaproteobacteria bacterium]|nr:hypothetical protein [Gammaproteobacteria bacterium]